jgi:NACalpha-BTF3-like transcription factor
VPIVPTNMSAAIAGAHAAQQTHARQAPKKPEETRGKKATTPRDQVELTVTGVEHENAIRDLKDSSQEESREDRQAHGDDLPPPPRHLDLEA